jgi:hypothetical protein
MHPTSEDDHSSIGKSISDILKESDYDYSVTISHTQIGGVGEEKDKR